MTLEGTDVKVAYPYRGDRYNSGSDVEKAQPAARPKPAQATLGDWVKVLGIGAAAYVGFSLLMMGGAMVLLLLGPFGLILVLGALSASGKKKEQRYYGKYEV